MITDLSDAGASSTARFDAALATTRLTGTAGSAALAYRVADLAGGVRRALSAHFLARDPHRSGLLLEDLAHERTAQDALEELLLVAADTLRLLARHPSRRGLVLEQDAVVNQLLFAQLIRPGQRPLVAELLRRASGLAGGLRCPGDPHALAGLSDHQVLVGAWATVLGLIWTTARVLDESQMTVYLRVLNSADD